MRLLYYEFIVLTCHKNTTKRDETLCQNIMLQLYHVSFEKVKYSSIEEQKTKKLKIALKVRAISVIQEKYIYSVQNWRLHKPRILNFQLFIEYTLDQ